MRLVNIKGMWFINLNKKNGSWEKERTLWDNNIYKGNLEKLFLCRIIIKRNFSQTDRVKEFEELEDDNEMLNLKEKTIVIKAYFYWMNHS